MHTYKNVIIYNNDDSYDTMLYFKRLLYSAIFIFQV